MAIGTVAVGSPKNITASAVIAGGTAMARTTQGLAGDTAKSTYAEQTTLQGAILGFYVNSTSSGTIALSTNNAGAAGTALSGTITPAIGWHHYPIVSATGIFATIGATINVTFVVVE